MARRAVLTEAEGINVRISPEPLSPSKETPCDPQLQGHSCRWWPYSNSNDFGANTAMILIILLCALICALALNAAIRCFIRSSSSRHPRPPSSSARRLPQTQLDHQLDDQRWKTNAEGSVAPTVAAPRLVYSAGMKLGGAEADCAICLSEFVEGDGIRVLGNCKHGFHVHCIEQWLCFHSSCPTCRRSCLTSSSSPIFSPEPPAPDLFPVNDFNNRTSQAEMTSEVTAHIA